MAYRPRSWIARMLSGPRLIWNAFGDLQTALLGAAAAGAAWLYHQGYDEAVRRLNDVLGIAVLVVAAAAIVRAVGVSRGWFEDDGDPGEDVEPAATESATDPGADDALLESSAPAAPNDRGDRQ